LTIKKRNVLRETYVANVCKILQKLKCLYVRENNNTAASRDIPANARCVFDRADWLRDTIKGTVSTYITSDSSPYFDIHK